MHTIRTIDYITAFNTCQNTDTSEGVKIVAEGQIAQIWVDGQFVGSRGVRWSGGEIIEFSFGMDTPTKKALQVVAKCLGIAPRFEESARLVNGRWTYSQPKEAEIFMCVEY